MPILEITQAADVGMGSFYNHFETKEQLFEAAVEAVMDAYGAAARPAHRRHRGPRRGVRLQLPAHRAAAPARTRTQPRPAQQRSPACSAPTDGLAPRARRDITAAVDAGRFDVDDVDIAVTMTAGALLALGQLLHDQPDRDVEQTTDRMTEDLLRMFGVPRRQAQPHLFAADARHRRGTRQRLGDLTADGMRAQWVDGLP